MDLPDAKPHILVVDDDSRLRELLRQFLSDQGFIVTAAIDAKDAGRKMELFLFDLMVVDVMMPGETGVAFLARLREKGGAPPALLLTAMGEAEDRITGLEAGADDYLVKPFDPRELVLRIQAILRRSAPPEALSQAVNFGEYRFEPAQARLLKHGEPVALTTSESQLLKALSAQADAPVSREALARALGGSDNERTVDVHITRLRKKLEADSARPYYLQTVRGAGYVLRTGG